MDTTEETRRARLREVVDRYFGGVSGQLADAVKRPRPNISQVLSGKRPFGEILARDIESRLNLARGWLDREGGDDGESMAIAKKYEDGGDGKKAAMKALADLPEDAAADIRPILEALKAKYRTQ